ncbi:AAA family ATPase [Streptomyces sp. NPDC088788]|uniref:ATP-binding protein n=1 Tax=Streptomyces sp. NPDC088788 TaxID=3365898 RepID=UPI0037F1BD4C
MTVETIVFMATAVILPLLLSEFGDWCPWLAKRLTRWTARRLGDAQAAERYSEEWLAELAHLPGKLSHLLTATSYLLALPRIRWSLRSTRRTAPAGPSLDELLPRQIATSWDSRQATMRFAPQAEAAFGLHLAIVHDNPQVRNRLHFLMGPPGCGKTTVARWLHDEFVQEGKKIHYVWAGAWINQDRPLHVSAQMRDRLIQASQGVDLLLVDEADQATVQALAALRLPCPVLVLARTCWQFREITNFPASTGVVVDMGPIIDRWRAALGADQADRELVEAFVVAARDRAQRQASTSYRAE